MARRLRVRVRAGYALYFPLGTPDGEVVFRNGIAGPAELVVGEEQLLGQEHKVEVLDELESHESTSAAAPFGSGETLTTPTEAEVGPRKSSSCMSPGSDGG